jgi:hypothetical protein
MNSVVTAHAARIVEQAAIEHAIEKQRRRYTLSAILAPDLRALGGAEARPLFQDDIEKARKLHVQSQLRAAGALDAAPKAAPQDQDNILKMTSQRMLEEQRRQATLHQIMAAFPRNINPLSASISRQSSGGG